MKNQIPYLIAVMLFYSIAAIAGDKPAYVLYAKGGKEIKYSKMLKDLQDADLIFFGELHTDPIAHWLQMELAQDLFKTRGADLVLGAEMFEADDQLILDEYLDSLYASDKFEAEMKLWNNYKTDYKPLVEFARIHGIPFVATNIPRRYASMVHKGGFEALEALKDEALHYIAPLPIRYDPSVKCYADMMHMHGMEGHVNENFPKAQAIKDATMAHFILENRKDGQVFLHLNGSYHSRNFEGIVWHIRQTHPDLEILTIETIQQDQVDSLDEDEEGIADYIIVIPSNMTRTSR